MSEDDREWKRMWSGPEQFPDYFQSQRRKAREGGAHAERFADLVAGSWKSSFQWFLFLVCVCVCVLRGVGGGYCCFVVFCFL